MMLPLDIWSEIFRCCSPVTLWILAQVCKDWRREVQRLCDRKNKLDFRAQTVVMRMCRWNIKPDLNFNFFCRCDRDWTDFLFQKALCLGKYHFFAEYRSRTLNWMASQTDGEGWHFRAAFAFKFYANMMLSIREHPERDMCDLHNIYSADVGHLRTFSNKILKDRSFIAMSALMKKHFGLLHVSAVSMNMFARDGDLEYLIRGHKYGGPISVHTVKEAAKKNPDCFLYCINHCQRKGPPLTMMEIRDLVPPSPEYHRKCNEILWQMDKTRYEKAEIMEEEIETLVSAYKDSA